MNRTALQNQIDLIETTLDELLTPPEGPYKTIYQAARYSLLSSGKRIRPLLTLATAQSFHVSIEKALVPACSIEMIHTYSLIHDDLPSMDDDDLRRGKPTLHKVYPEGQALLAGDLLLTFAFETLTNTPYLTPLQKVKMVQVLSQRSGGSGMIGGQSLDLFSEGKQISWRTLQDIHIGKTASLLSACLEIGAIIADLPTYTSQKLRDIGTNIGLSFQIIDDVLDIEGDAKLLGKPLLSDLENSKSTSVSLLGLSAAKNLAEDLLERSLALCTEIGIEGSPLASMLPKLVHREF